MFFPREPWRSIILSLDLNKNGYDICATTTFDSRGCLLRKYLDKKGYLFLVILNN